MKDSLKFAAKTDVGLIRKSNEDNYGYVLGSEGWPAAFFLADGMGGHLNGELASKTAVEYCRERLERELGKLNQPERVEILLSDIMQKANVKVYLKSLEDKANSGMGTTLTLTVFFPDSVYLAHIGDSRCYILRGGIFEKISRDHTVTQEMMDAGIISEDEGACHPQRHVLTQALGSPEYLQPEVLHLDRKRHDRYLICSDGLHGFVDDYQIGETLRMATDPENCAGQLIELAMKAGAPDNVTVIVVYA